MIEYDAAGTKDATGANPAPHAPTGTPTYGSFRVLFDFCAHAFKACDSGRLRFDYVGSDGEKLARRPAGLQPTDAARPGRIPRLMKHAFALIPCTGRG